MGGQADNRYGQLYKTGKRTDDGKEICKPSQDARGCNDNRCKKAHACDIMVSEDRICGSYTHNRQNHRGKTIPL